MSTDNIIQIEKEKFRKMVKLARNALIIAFVYIAIMLFHVLIDFFYHT